MLASVLAALLLLAVPEEAPAPDPMLQVTHGLPVPEQFQGNTEITVRFEHPLMVEWHCLGGKFDPDWMIYACYLPSRNPYNDVIVMPNPCMYPEARLKDSYAYLMCHEMAHKNGWKH